jgi:cell wall-associated NlpC family hydrolase
MKKSFVLAGLLLTPTLLSAQTRTVLAPYVGTDRLATGNPVVVGATLGWEIGHVAARWGVAVDATKAPTAYAGERGEGRVGSDVDAMLFLAHPNGAARLIPFALGGVGVRVARPTGDPELSAVWAAGGGVRVPIAGRLALETELRRTQLLTPSTDAMAPRPETGVELRAGVSLRLGGSPGRAVVPPSLLPAPLPARPPAPPTADRRAGAMIAWSAISEAERHLGITYRWGGNTPDTGFDCSGFIRYVYRLQGIDLPRVSQDQARAGVPVPLDLAAFEPGDLLAFASRGTVDHVAIYIGDGRIIHASSSGGNVRYDDLRSARGSWYLRHMVAARRVVPEG